MVQRYSDLLDVPGEKLSDLNAGFFEYVEEGQNYRKVSDFFCWVFESLLAILISARNAVLLTAEYVRSIRYPAVKSQVGTRTLFLLVARPGLFKYDEMSIVNTFVLAISSDAMQTL